MAVLISSIGLRFHQYADDTQLCVSFAATSFATGLKEVEDCILALRDWLAYNYPQLNPSKSEALLLGTLIKLQINKIGHMSTVTVAGVSIKLSSNIKNLGVYLDSSLALNL